MAEIAIENGSLMVVSARNRPKVSNFSNGIPLSEQYSPKYSYSSPGSNRSMPAGTEVCVVKTLLDRQASNASSKLSPYSSMNRRMRSIARNAEWPSFM